MDIALLCDTVGAVVTLIVGAAVTLTVGATDAVTLCVSCVLTVCVTVGATVGDTLTVSEMLAALLIDSDTSRDID